MRAGSEEQPENSGSEAPHHRKPANLLYGLEEVPPAGTRLGLAFQHVFVMSVGWIFVVVMVSSFGGTSAQSESVIRLSMIASGIATIFQSRPRPLGSGYLCPFSCGPAYLPASILAGQTGGFPLLWTMTAISGVFEAALSRLMKKLRILFPPEVTGLVVSMVGIELISLGCPRFLGFTSRQPAIDPSSTIVAAVTLAAMIAPTIWGKGKWRLYPVLLGLLAGYVSGAALGILHLADFDPLRSEPLFGLPHRLSWAFDFRLPFLLPFLIASLSSILKSVGDLTFCQKINDSEWKRTDMSAVSGGILSGAIGTFLAGLMGGAGQSTFSSNVALEMATGATSRSIALPTGLIIVVLAFFPKVAAVFAMMPQPVMGAVLVYVAAFMILGGLAVMTSRMLDARRIFVIGLPMIFGLSVEITPQLYGKVPPALHPIFASALSLSTVLVVILNLVFRIGIARRRKMEFALGPGVYGAVSQFLEAQGGAWGMRPEVVQKADDALHEFLIHASALRITSPVTIEARFDEFNFDLGITYEGLPFVILDHLPSWKSVTEVDEMADKMSAYLVRQYADSIATATTEGRCRIHLHFDH